MPDYIGFGRSLKLPDTGDYSYQAHVNWLVSFLKGMSLQRVTEYFFDRGGFFGLRIAAGHPDFFDRWREQQFAQPRFPQGEMVNEGVLNKLRPEIIAAYDATYPDESFKTGPRRFPMILPIMPDDPAAIANTVAWEVLGRWQEPVLTLFSASFAGSRMDPERLIAHIPGARDQDRALIGNASFYIVEDSPDELARRVVTFAVAGG